MFKLSLTLFFVFLFLVSSVTAYELKENYMVNDDTQMYIHSTQWAAQTFNTSVGYDLKVVGIKLYQATDYMINVSLYSTNASGYPETFSTSWCYQETANVSTSCGGLDTGTYSCDGTWDGTNNCSNTYDGDWSTYGDSGVGQVTYVYINYTNPNATTDVTVSNATLNTKIGNEGNETRNLDAECWNRSIVELKIESDHDGVSVDIYCYNGSTWRSVGSDLASPFIYEEGINWEITSRNEPLVSAEVNGSTLGETPGAFVNFTFDTPYTLVADTTYAIVAFADCVGMTGTDWRLDQTDAAYDGGVRYTSTTTGASWTGNSDDDMMFATYNDAEAPADTCTCAGIDTNWEIDLSDTCNMTSACDIGTGELTFTGTGTFRCNETLTIADMRDLAADQHIIVQDNCNIIIG